MMLCKWEALPDNLRLDAVRPYYDILSRKRLSLAVKRLFDFFAALLLLVLLAPIMLILSLVVCLDSKGSAIYSQERVTQYGRSFKIYKFRTMVDGADHIGAQVTSGNDSRITRVGRVLRKTRLDELPQLFNILTGDMSLVGTRPEVPQYVREYTPEMMATLLLPAGVTSETSILFKDEAKILDEAEDVDKTYVEELLPGKMRHNLNWIENFSLMYDLKLLFMTVFAVFGRTYEDPLEDAE